MRLGRVFGTMVGRKITAPLTLSYTHGASETPLLHTTIGQYLLYQVEHQPDKTFLVFPHQNIRKTYAEFYLDAKKLASGLLGLGVERGDRVGIWAPNTYEWTLTQYATAMAGFIMGNVNPAYQAHELEFVLRKISMRALIAADSFKSQDYHSILCAAAPGLSNGSHRNEMPFLEHVVMFGGAPKPGTLTWQDMLDAGTPETDALVDNLVHSIVQPDDPVNIQFTSGTTGNPKGVVLSHNGTVNNSYFIGRRAGMHQHEDIIICAPPLFHCFGSVGASLAGMVHGCTVVFPSAGFDPRAALRAIQDESATVVYGTPTMFIDILHQADFDEYDLSTLRSGVMAGAPCPPHLCQQLITHMNMHDFAIMYGSTETSPVSFGTLLSEPPVERVKSIGTAIDHVEGKIVDQEGQLLPIGKKGELWTRGYNTMLAYWDDPVKTAEAVGQDRWYRTGDLAIMNEKGQVTIAGRSKDMIIRGGENIYPAEIEHFLQGHPDVQEVQIFGIPDARLGEEVCAWITSKNPELTPGQLKDFCKGQLSHFKIPRYIEFKTAEEFPRTISGKIQKFRMKEMAIEELGLGLEKAAVGR